MILSKNVKFILLFLSVLAVFYHKFILFGRLPIPADTIVGMYHPFRDNVWDNYKNGVPFKNPLITDPVRQQYVWRELAVDAFKKGMLPIWNPYSFAGAPLLANIQAAAFYPMNLLFFIFPFSFAWGLQIVASQAFSGIFLFLFLLNLGVRRLAALFGAVSFVFSGFVISWLTWNTIIHVAAWSILSLLAVDKSLSLSLSGGKGRHVWNLILLVSLLMSFTAGHLQIFFYGQILILAYFIFRLFYLKKNKFAVFCTFLTVYLIFAAISIPQSKPLIDLINLSSRSVDQTGMGSPGWFIPWQNFIQFIAPDYFGNPATGNYFGVWNYAEFVGFIGVIPVVFSIFALFFIREKQVLFFTLVLMFSLIFAFPTAFARIPFILGIPLISTSQPTRLIFLADIALSVLAAFGFDRFLKSGKSLKLQGVFSLLAILLLAFYFFADSPVSRRNLVLPTVISVSSAVFSAALFFKKAAAYRGFYGKILVVFLLSFSCFDLLRFAGKFTPFTPKTWLYPRTRMTEFLMSDREEFRIMSLDRRIMPPNFSASYRFQDVSGYDPLYLRDYGKLVSSWNSGIPEKNYASFNRILTPDNWKSRITDLLNVKYVLSLVPVESDRLKLVMTEGETMLYENTGRFKRAWIAGKLKRLNDPQEELETLFDSGYDLRSVVLTSENFTLGSSSPETGENKKEFLDIISWSENRIEVRVVTVSEKIVVFSEIFHPLWSATVDGKTVPLHRVNYILRGVVVPAGEHLIVQKAKII